MKDRTFGWVQDPGNLENLRLVVEVFDSSSSTHKLVKDKTIPDLILEEDGKSHLISELNKIPLKLSYRDLVGTAFKPRSSARCNAIIQATIKGQKRPFISDWPADNFLRWAQSLGFIIWEQKTDSFSITELGKQFSNTTKGSEEEYLIFEQAFLSYPPVTRIINLLCEASENNEALTKFEIGKNLGFIGEAGFTSISQSLFVKTIAMAKPYEKAEIRSNWEGDSDKYARMICSWLTQLKFPWIEKTKKTVVVNFGGKSFSHEFGGFTLTKKGFEIRKRISGSSKFKKVPKLVNFEMLCTKGVDRKYLRTRRANIIELLSKHSLSREELQAKLEEKGFYENLATITDDIQGLKNIGLSIVDTQNRMYCSDIIIGLTIPVLQPEEAQKSYVLDQIEQCRETLSFVPHDYLVLISMGFDKNQSAIFEIKAIELLTEYCNFLGLHLGGGNRPDGIVYSSNYGIIIDTKSYEGGFNIPVTERDKMKRYIEENINRDSSHNKTKWWEEFPSTLSDFRFIFISGKFGGNFKDQLRILGDQTKTLGCALSSYALLNLADQVIGKKMSHEEFKTSISCLDNVVI